ncbi:MAG TPA: peptide chain release factor N(5)-glutamine methyltransferase [Arenimonas sp.]|nr:peptide chain release factor N(5)-glutamine methyltransferase [Arenimonas sp.]
MSSLGEALRHAAATLPGDSARIDAEALLAEALGKPRSWLYAHGNDALQPDAASTFAALLERRRQGEPVAHILGRRGFWSMELVVNADTLIPRPETELLVELALARLPADRSVRVLDLGTGSGAIALAIASERPRADVIAVDASRGALQIAQKNAARLGLGNVRALQGDWFSPVADERFDVIVSNPPYIADDDPHLQQGDLRFEPRAALASGHDGLDDIRRIASDAPSHLASGGWLLVEHGWEQGEAVRAIFSAAGFDDVQTARDLEARDRVTLGLKR